MKKRIFRYVISVLLILSILFTFTSCQDKKPKENIKLSIWVSGEIIDLTNSILEEYAKAHPDKNYEFIVSEQSESSCATVIKADVDNAADIFVFADDQLDNLIDIGILKPVSYNVSQTIENFGGLDSNAALASMRNGELYAYPRNAGNGYFLYYNKAYFSEKDVATLEGILNRCQVLNKKFSMEITSGWYLYSFFHAAGLKLTIKDDQTICNWNTTEGKYTGVDVFNAICKYTEKNAFLCATNETFIEKVNDGTIIAAVNGPWNANLLKENWNENLAATKLPTYNLKGDNLQMSSFSGYKLIGVNATSPRVSEAEEVAEFLANEENQLKLFDKTGELPANVNASQNVKVAVSPVASALIKQGEYSTLQRVPSTFWTSSRILGTFIGSANKDNFDPQQVLDAYIEDLMGE